MKNTMMTEPKETTAQDELEQDTNLDDDFDQTTFADGLPYRNQGSRKFTVKKTDEELAAEKKAQKKQKIIFGSVAAGVFLVVVVGLWATMMRNAPIIPDEVKPLAPVQPINDGFTRKIDDAQVLLKEADPSISEYQIPPVSLQLRLDPAERR
jgi:hypothetical protein